MNNLLSFLPDFHLASDVGCLLTFLRQPLDRNSFFKNFPLDILKTKLGELAFDNSEGIPSIRLKKSLEEKFNVPNKLLSLIGLSQNELIKELQYDKFLEPELTLKEALEKSIASHNKNIINISITNFINTVQEKNFQLYEKNEKKTEIDLFFNFLKIFIQRFALTKNDSFVSSDSLLDAAANLTVLYIANLNSIVTALENNIIYKAVFSYGILFEKLSNLIPNSNQKTIKQLLDSLAKNTINNQLLLKYDFFKKAYFSEEGFSTIFYNSNGDDYRLIQTCQKKFDSLSDSYQNFVQLIEALTLHTNKIDKITDLAVTLKKATDIYFQSVLYNTVFKLESLNEIAFATFKGRIESEILNFQKQQLCSIEIKGILNKLLNALAKLVPSFLVSKEKRINFFHRRTSETKLFNKIENTIPLMKI